jgi:hypothetical protein
MEKIKVKRLLEGRSIGLDVEGLKSIIANVG